MVLWFTGTAMIAMWFTFRDPAIDHRFVIVGALFPELVSAFFAQASFTHNLFIPIVLMGVLMLLTIGRRQIRRKGIAIPIGMFWHLIFDGAWANASLFWWPLGSVFGKGTPVAVGERGFGIMLLLELLGLLLCGWFWLLAGLNDRDRRQRFLRAGRLDRDVTERGSED